jgi:hypothetical protein
MSRAYLVTAQYETPCGNENCDKPIRKGDRIIGWGGDDWQHEECFEKPFRTGPMGGYHGPEIVDNS